MLIFGRKLFNDPADMPATRRLAAILAADVAGYSRLIGADEQGTLEQLRTIRTELVDPSVAGHNGRLVKTAMSRKRVRAGGPAG